MTTATSLAQRIIAAFNAGDVDAFADCFALDAVQVHPFFPEPLRRREAIRVSEGAMFAAFEHISLDVTNVVEAANRVAMELVVTATNTKPLALPDGTTLPATGKTVHLTMSAFLTLDEAGQIIEAHRYQDNLAFMRQLGIA